MESHKPNELLSWSVPQCPFTVDYAVAVLDDIRLAVVDAFFSLPRGGAEIGGVLLGSHVDGKVTVSGYLPLDCEHALGPSFTLSARDEAGLAQILASPERRTRGSQPVGWYHSHTRSEISLSEADLAIYNRYFPESWQVALVLKPHTFHPTRGGFFFRDRDGAIHSTASLREFVMQPLPVRPLPAGMPASTPASHAPVDASARGRVITVATERAAPEAPTAPALAVAEPATEVPTETAEPALPRFAEMREERSWRWLKRLLAAAAGIALGCVAFQTRDLWLPPITALVHPSSSVGPGVLGLSMVETDGQLRIYWNPQAPKLRNGTNALLEILDGSPIPRGILLDSTHLQAGVITYSRQSERVDATLVTEQPDGQKVRQSTTFLGPKPSSGKPGEDPALRKERDELATQVTLLQSDLAAQIERNKMLEKSLEDARSRLKEQQRKRLSKQIPRER